MSRKIFIHPQNIECHLSTERYHEGEGLALILNAADDGEPCGVITVNVPDAKLAANEILVKDYSENAGMANALVSCGLAVHTGRTVKSGFVSIPVMRLNADVLKEYTGAD